MLARDARADVGVDALGRVGVDAGALEQLDLAPYGAAATPSLRHRGKVWRLEHTVASRQYPQTPVVKVSVERRDRAGRRICDRALKIAIWQGKEAEKALS
jgi:hypothetical protein